ncbi:MAG: sigma-70 family RNA polymerase sigma factor [Planctomycetes bacterium]|nr:sigma-70 family RNA polymerase sigma factor [Planctomycetota bacterium]
MLTVETAMDIPDLIARARAGDLAAYGDLVVSTQSMVHAICLRILRDEEDAQDVVQDTYIRAFRRLADLEEPAAFPGWLRAIAIGVARNARRSRRGTLVPLEAPYDPPALDATEDHWNDRQRRALAAAMLTLDAVDRSLCDRRYHGGWDIPRLAAESRISEPAMRKRLQRIRDHLRKEIEMDESQGITDLRRNLPERIVELLARPRLHEVPDNPVARTFDALREAYPEHTQVELPEIVDLAEARRAIGVDAVYVPMDTLQRIDDDRVLRYDLTLPVLMTVRYRGKPLRLIATGKVYRADTVDATHLDAFHQAESFLLDDRDRIDEWQMAGRVLRSIHAVVPGRELRISPVTYPMCSSAWSLDVRVDDRWVEVMAWGLYVSDLVRVLGGDPHRHCAMGAGYGLDRLAGLRYGIDDLRKMAQTRTA